MKKINFKTMLATISLLAVAPISLNILACSINDNSPLAKKSLSDLVKIRNINGSVANEVGSVLEELARLNPGLQTSDVEVTYFTKATEDASGSMVIQAKPNSNYIGVVGITIAPVPRLDLEKVIRIREVDGRKFNDAKTVLYQIERLNPNLIGIYVEIKDFKAATETTSGSAKIIAKENTKYTGQVDIIITQLPKIWLSSVINISIVDGIATNDAKSVLKEVARLNPKLDLKDVTIIRFIPATEATFGSGSIIAKENTKYTGEVDITITTLSKIELKDVVTVKEVDSANANDGDSVLKEVVRLNPRLNINEIHITDFKSATELTVGSAIIEALPNTRYIGRTGITITPLKKLELNEIIKIKTVDGNLANNEDAVLAEVARLNPRLIINNVEIKNFKAATKITTGSAQIVAKLDSNYTGEVDIKIRNLESTDEQYIVNTINATKFTKSISLNTTVEELRSKTNAEFIKNRLTEKFQDLLKDNLFTLNKISDSSGKELSDVDLRTTATIKAKINYNYGEINNQNANLIITVKEITISPKREAVLNKIKAESDADREGEEWVKAWFTYFETIKDEINLFTFQFPQENQTEKQILQNIIYDELKLVMETDFKLWNIAKGYDPDSIAADYSNFEINEKNRTITAVGRLSMNVRYHHQFWRNHQIFFKYKIDYMII